MKWIVLELTTNINAFKLCLVHSADERADFIKDDSHTTSLVVDITGAADEVRHVVNSNVLCELACNSLTLRNIISRDALCKKASNHHANLPLEMYRFTL